MLIVHRPSHLMSVCQMKFHLRLGLNLNPANLANFILDGFALVLFLDVKIHSPLLRKSLPGAVRTFVNLLARVNTKMSVEVEKFNEKFHAERKFLTF